MRQILVIIFLINSMAYGMEKQEKPTKFVPGHRRTCSISDITDPRLKELTQRLPTGAALLRQPSDLPIVLDPIKLYQDVEQLNKQKKNLEEEKQQLTNKNNQLTKEIESLNTQIGQLKQPNKFIRFYVATTLSCMIGTLAYFTYPWWSQYVKGTLSSMLYYKSYHK